MRDTHPMSVAGPLQAGVSLPSVRVHRAARFHTVTDKLAQSGPRGVCEVAQANPSHRIPVQFHGDHDQALAGQLPSADTGLRPAHIRLVHFHLALKALAVEPDHRGAQLLQQQPGCLIAANSQGPLQTSRTQAGFLGAGQPHRQEPAAQRNPGLVQHCARCWRRLPPAGGAEYLASGCRPRPRTSALRTNESLRPAQIRQVFATIVLSGESRRERQQIPGESICVFLTDRCDHTAPNPRDKSILLELNAYVGSENSQSEYCERQQLGIVFRRGLQPGGSRLVVRGCDSTRS